ncbi:Uncharacterised protein [Mycobacteroides abscessus subsp. abscessus]|nr:Uncharacterised protein [Mycobacteroides abscessus subsp. abscessus]
MTLCTNNVLAIFWTSETFACEVAFAPSPRMEPTSAI